MGGQDVKGSRSTERQRLIERLDAKEAGLAASRSGDARSSAEELEAEIENERQRNFVRMAFGQMWGA